MKAYMVTIPVLFRSMLAVPVDANSEEEAIAQALEQFRNDELEDATTDAISAVYEGDSPAEIDTSATVTAQEEA